jgi:hypothetical protein
VAVKRLSDNGCWKNISPRSGDCCCCFVLRNACPGNCISFDNSLCGSFKQSTSSINPKDRRSCSIGRTRSSVRWGKVDKFGLRRRGGLDDCCSCSGCNNIGCSDHGFRDRHRWDFIDHRRCSSLDERRSNRRCFSCSTRRGC